MEEDGTSTDEYYYPDGSYESTTYFNDGSSEYYFEDADGVAYETTTDWEGNETREETKTNDEGLSYDYEQWTDESGI
jgi:hypothetical protein